MKQFLIDMDGTLYRGDTPIDGAREFIRLLQEKGIPFLLLTNCPLKSAAALQAKLAGMGIPVPAAQIMTAGTACAAYITERYPGKRIYVLGSESLRNIIGISGATVCSGEMKSADAVVTGHTSDLTYDRLCTAAGLIRNGADFIATNPDAAVPHGSGFVPHTGALASYLETASGKKPFFIGKPFPYMLTAALKQLKAQKKDCMMIGDNADTDYAFAAGNGMDGGIVLTGMTDYDTALQKGVPENRIFRSLPDIPVDAW